MSVSKKSTIPLPTTCTKWSPFHHFIPTKSQQKQGNDDMWSPPQTKKRANNKNTEFPGHLPHNGNDSCIDPWERNFPAPWWMWSQWLIQTHRNNDVPANPWAWRGFFRKGDHGNLNKWNLSKPKHMGATPKMVGFPNKPMGFPTKNDHFGVWNGVPLFSETSI